MKTLLFTLLLNFVCVFVFAQTKPEKTINITKISFDEKGNKSSESISKKGAAAEAFDVEKYINENKKEGVSLNIRIENGPDDVIIRQIGDNNSMSSKGNCNNSNWSRVKSWSSDAVENLDPEKGFLGVEQDNGEDEDEEGVVVRVQRKGAAAEAGLKTNDIILSIDEVKLNAWEDLTDFMSSTKSGQKVKIAYERDGKTETTDAILKQNKVYNYMNDAVETLENVNVNVNYNNQTKEACLGVYSSAYRDGDARGAIINGFTDASAAKEATMKEGDIITQIQGISVDGFQSVWNVIAKYKPEDKVEVIYLRDNQTKTIVANLKSCKDRSSTVTINTNKPRSFTTWNWGETEEKKFDRKRVITIRKSEGDSEKIDIAQTAANDRKLNVENFKAYPSPTTGPITLEFKAEAVPTIVSMYELSGKQLFREELNAFNGDYQQEFDLSAFAKGAVMIRVEQGEKIFTEQILVN
jgi:membrane-associated protease RseP (regulator of RpoE activity)